MRRMRLLILASSFFLFCYTFSVHHARDILVFLSYILDRIWFVLCLGHIFSVGFCYWKLKNYALVCKSMDGSIIHFFSSTEYNTCKADSLFFLFWTILHYFFIWKGCDFLLALFSTQIGMNHHCCYNQNNSMLQTLLWNMCHLNLIELRFFFFLNSKWNKPEKFRWTQIWWYTHTIGSHQLRHNNELIILIEYIRNMSQFLMYAVMNGLSLLSLGFSFVLSFIERKKEEKTKTNVKKMQFHQNKAFI